MVYPLIAWWIFPWRTVSHNQMVIHQMWNPELSIACCLRKKWRTSNSSKLLVECLGFRWHHSACGVSFSAHFLRNHLPSGKLTVCYGKSPFLMGKLTISTGPFSIAMLNYQRVEKNGCHWAIDWWHGLSFLASILSLPPKSSKFSYENFSRTWVVKVPANVFPAKILSPSKS
jgi:hypothetical protein